MDAFVLSQQCLNGFRCVSVGKNPPANAGDMGLIPAWEDTLEREITMTSVFLLWKSHGQWNRAGYSPWSHKSQT